MTIRTIMQGLQQKQLHSKHKPKHIVIYASTLTHNKVTTKAQQKQLHSKHLSLIHI